MVKCFESLSRRFNSAFLCVLCGKGFFRFIASDSPAQSQSNIFATCRKKKEAPEFSGASFHLESLGSKVCLFSHEIRFSEGIFEVHMIGICAVKNGCHVFGENQFFIGWNDIYLDR